MRKISLPLQYFLPMMSANRGGEVFLRTFVNCANLSCLTDIQLVMLQKNEESRLGVIYGGFIMAFGGTGVYYDNSLLFSWLIECVLLSL